MINIPLEFDILRNCGNWFQILIHFVLIVIKCLLHINKTLKSLGGKKNQNSRLFFFFFFFFFFEGIFILIYWHKVFQFNSIDIWLVQKSL